MDQKKYVAYVGTYTHGSSKGIHIYDMGVENGRAVECKVVPINNPFYIKKSHNEKYFILSRMKVYSPSGRGSGTDEQCIHLWYERMLSVYGQGGQVSVCGRLA